MRRIKCSDARLHIQTGGDGEHTDVVLFARVTARDKIRQRQIRAFHAVNHLFFVALTSRIPAQQFLRFRLVRVQHDFVIIHRLRGIQAVDAFGGEPFFRDDLLQHGLRIGKHLTRLLTDHFVIKNLRIRADQIPHLEKR